MGLEPDLGRQQVHPLAEPGIGGNEHPVALIPKNIGDAGPAPAAAPGAVAKYDRGHRLFPPRAVPWAVLSGRQDFLDADIVDQMGAADIFQMAAFLIVVEVGADALGHGQDNRLIAHVQPV